MALLFFDLVKIVKQEVVSYVIYLDSNYTQCGLLHAKKSNCGRHDCIGYMGTNTSVLHGYCKPREYQFLNIKFD